MNPRKRSKRCRTTHKIRWVSRLDAQMALADVQRKDKHVAGHSEQRVYRCPDCDDWHLTSQARRR